jgi:F0F1-type ATP synthase beta subunit
MSTATATGRVTQVIGSTFDAEFPEGSLPQIYNAVKVNSVHKGVTLKSSNTWVADACERLPWVQPKA